MSNEHSIVSMGLIYKVGNTVQSIPFPRNSLFSTTTSIALSILISIFLSFIQWTSCLVTHSLSLSVIGTLQIIITCFLSLFITLNTFQDRNKQQKIRFLSFFLGGFFISLSCGYLLLDAFALFSTPTLHLTRGLWASSLASLFGNILIIQILSRARVIPFKVKTLQIPFFSIILLSLLHIASLIFIFSFNWWQVDVIIGLFAAAIICVWGAVTFLDAYWQMVELDKIPSH